MAMSCRSAFLEAAAKLIVLFLLWLVSVLVIYGFNFKWTAPLKSYVANGLIGEAIFLVFTASVIMASLMAIISALLFILERRNSNNPEKNFKFLLEFSADLADNLGTSLALLAFSFLAIFVFSDAEPFHLATALFSALISYLLITYGKRFAV